MCLLNKNKSRINANSKEMVHLGFQNVIKKNYIASKFQEKDVNRGDTIVAQL